MFFHRDIPAPKAAQELSHRQCPAHVTPLSGTAAQLALQLRVGHLHPFTAVYLPLCCKTPAFTLLSLAHLSFHIPEYTGGVLLFPQGMIFFHDSLVFPLYLGMLST